MHFKTFSVRNEKQNKARLNIKGYHIKQQAHLYKTIIKSSNNIYF